jgi:site-specific recombinase XerD
MMDEGLRISEALNIAPHHVLSNRKIKIIGLKGSRNRIISVTQYWGYWESYKRQSCCINQVYNRFFFYRLFKKHGLSMDLVNSNRKAVTHSFRHAYIKQLKAEGIATELTAAEIGHKSTKSTQHYEEQ